MTDIDIHSKTWQTVNAYIEKKKENTMKAVLQNGCTADQTQYMRGYYAALQELKDMAEPQKQKLTAQSGSYL